MTKRFAICLGLAIALNACNSSKKAPDTSRTASLSIGGLNIPANAPQWNLLKLEFKKNDPEAKTLSKEYAPAAFTESKLNDVSVKVEFGRYLLLLQYQDASRKIVYQSCGHERSREHIIEQSLYETNIDICPEGSDTPVAQVPIRPSSNVTLTPQFGGGSKPPAGPLTPVTCKNEKGQVLTGHDQVLGQCIDQKTSWSVQEGEILFEGQPFSLKGINWFGFDSSDNKLHGLWSGRSIESFLDQIKGLGFNALRIPLSPQTLITAESLAQLKALLAASQERKIAILLDMHTCSVSAGHLSGSPESDLCPGYKKQNWLNDLKTLASLSRSYSYVVGIDLYNEPYKLSWNTWRSWASEAAQVVLTENPRILAFVEGVASAEGTPYGKYAPFFGENLFEADSKPLDIPASRLVLSPHAYGPSVFADHDYFKSQAYPGNMPMIWDEHFGYLRDKKYALAVGEFGGRYTGADKQWQDTFVSYLVKKNIKHFFYWSLNPNSGDTGGLLNDDWKTVNQAKLELLKPLLK